MKSATSVFKRRTHILAAIGLLLVFGQCHALSIGTVIDLGTLDGNVSKAFYINASSQVVGSSTLVTGEERAFLYENGIMTDLGTLGGSQSYARSINDSSQIVGASQLANGEWRAFLYENGTMMDLGTLGGNLSGATDINEDGVIVGTAFNTTPGNGNRRAFVYENGTMSAIENPNPSPPSGNTYGHSVNDLGQVGGQAAVAVGEGRPFIWSDEQFDYTRIDCLSGGNVAVAVGGGINNHGVMIGQLNSEFNSAPAFRFDGTCTSLGTLGGDASFTGSINDAGMAVGWSETQGMGLHAYVWTEQEGMVDLNALLPVGSGWTLREARYINEDNNIVGYGEIDGETRAFLTELHLAEQLSCSGFLPPVGDDAVKVKKNRVIPFKAYLLDDELQYIDDLGISRPPVIQVIFDDGINPAEDVTAESLPPGTGTEGNQFEFLDSKWIFHLKTRDYNGPGTYTVTMESGVGSEYQIDPTCTGSFVIN